MNYRLTVVLADGSHVKGYARSEYSIGNYGTVYVVVDGKPYRAREAIDAGMKVICIEPEVRNVLRATGFPLAG